MTLVLENRLDLLVVMPTGHGKSAVFMIPPMITTHTIIVVVPLTIFVSGRDPSRLTTHDLSHGHDHV